MIARVIVSKQLQKITLLLLLLLLLFGGCAVEGSEGAVVVGRCALQWRKRVSKAAAGR